MIKERFGLTDRESEVVYTLYLTGYRNRQLAVELGCSLDTVKTHLRHAFKKMKVTNRAMMVAKINSVIGNQYEASPA